MSQTIDHNKYSYTRWKAKDELLHRWEKNEVQHPVRIHSFLKPILDKLQLYHANWSLVTRSGWGGPVDGFKAASYIDVFEKNEWLGTIEIGSLRGDRCYEITGPRVNAKLVRGRYMRTTDEKKAYKIIKDNFTARDFGEAASLYRGKAMSALTSAAGATRSRAWTAKEKVREHLVSYLADNFDTVSTALIAYGVTPQASRDLVELVAAEKLAESMREAASYRKRGWVVAKHHDRYLLTSLHEDATYKVVSESELTEDQKQKIALLKVFDRPGEPMEDVGMKADTDIYYLLG